MDTHPFRAAVEADDWGAVTALLHPDVRFRSPAVFKPYDGRDACLHLLRHVTQVFDNFRYIDLLSGTRTTGLVFRASVDGKDLDGWDYLTLDEQGLITDFMVMVRPLTGLIALAQAMSVRLENDPVPTG